MENLKTQLAAHFDAQKVKNEMVQWIRTWFDTNGPGCNAVIGISGGKDSSIVAALCVEALGKERVIGVLMPNLRDADADDAVRLCDHLGIRRFIVPVTMPVADVMEQMRGAGIVPTTQAIINLPARIRMAALYAVSQSMNGRVANTSNLSEDWVGYATRYGDSAGDFCPLAKLTVMEVKMVGYQLQLPVDLVDKAPSDGLCGQTDENRLGFSYDTLDVYIRTGMISDEDTKRRIDALHKENLFKLSMPPSYVPGEV